jgi:ethanolamine utilization protein EutA
MHELGFDHAHMTPEEEKRLADAIWTADNVELTTVGVDIGSSTSHLMFAKVHLQRLSTALSSRFVVVGREILWRSPILLTPYSDTATIDTKKLEAFIEGAYKSAGLGHDDIDSGAVILTGEALKRDNAEAIAHLFAAESGKFVCASAGHHMEAAMAAHGSGAAALSREQHSNILNVDMGGGTTKFGLMHGGKLLASAAIEVGGRLIAFDADGKLAHRAHPWRQAHQCRNPAFRAGHDGQLDPDDPATRAGRRRQGIAGHRAPARPSETGRHHLLRRRRRVPLRPRDGGS